METGGLGEGKAAEHGSAPVRSSVTQESKDTCDENIVFLLEFPSL